MTKSHRDWANVIGETHATGRTYLEKAFNAYYFLSEKNAVKQLLIGEKRASVIDVGTSYGNWYSFLKSESFNEIFGCEFVASRAKKAAKLGYKEVFNCDAARLPLADNVLQCAVSNDVFVHIIRTADQIAVLEEMHRCLTDDGIFVLNFASAKAFGYERDTVVDYCSYKTLASILNMVHEQGFLVEDIRPSYYSKPEAIKIEKLMRCLAVCVPFVGPRLLSILDRFIVKPMSSIEYSDYIYFKLRKSKLSN